MQPSPKLQQLLEAGLQQHGAALAARPRPGLLDEEMLAAVEAAGGPQVFEMMGQSGFLTNAQLFQTLQVRGLCERWLVGTEVVIAACLQGWLRWGRGRGWGAGMLQ
jgi:hypothetical protein